VFIKGLNVCVTDGNYSFSWFILLLYGEKMVVTKGESIMKVWSFTRWSDSSKKYRMSPQIFVKALTEKRAWTIYRKRFQDMGFHTTIENVSNDFGGFLQ